MLLLLLIMIMIMMMMMIMRMKMRMMLGCTCMKGTVQANWRRRRLSCHSAQSRECEAAKTQILKEEKIKFKILLIDKLQNI